MADAMAWVAYEHFPDAIEIQRMWIGWIDTGAFDSHKDRLAHYLATAERDHLPGWVRIADALRSHVRRELRSGEQARVVNACDYIQRAADKEAMAALEACGSGDRYLSGGPRGTSADRTCTQQTLRRHPAAARARRPRATCACARGRRAGIRRTTCGRRG